jgi:hypothetical protein
VIEWLSLCPNFTAMLDRLKVLFKEPLVHFTIFGLLLFLLYDWFGRTDSTAFSDRIEVPAARVEMMISRWEMQLGRSPTEQEVQSFIQGYIREEVLSREALALGLDQEDVIIRRRLAEKMEFLSLEMVSVEEPDSSELFHYYTNHRLNYQVPGDVTFYQVYFSTDTRTLIEAENVARAVLGKLHEEHIPGIRAEEFGDRFILPGFFPNYSTQDIEQLFNSVDFIERVFKAPLETWEGPVETSFGLHLVYVTDREDVRTEPFEKVYDRVYEDYMTSRQREQSSAYLQQLIDRYQVEIEAPYSDILKVKEKKGNQ